MKSLSILSCLCVLAALAACRAPAPIALQEPDFERPAEATFHLDELHFSAFAVPVAFVEVDEDDPAIAEPELDTGFGWGARIGVGDLDQSVGLMYVTTSHDEDLTGRSVDTHAAYLDFMARTKIWGDRGVGAWFGADAGIGLATIPFALPTDDLVGLAAQLRGTLDLQLSRSFAIDLGFGGFAWGYFGDTQAFGSLVTVGGKLSF
jgi:hypothetical protein